MNSLILQTWTRLLKPDMLLFSFFLLLVGHHEPGGGFIGGLVAAAAFCLSAVAYGVNAAEREVRFHPRYFIAGGLFLAGISGVLGLVLGKPFMTGLWTEVDLPLLGTLKVGTPLAFDVGVYFVVLGITIMIVFSLMEEQE